MSNFDTAPVRRLFGPPPKPNELEMLTMLAEEEIRPVVHGVLAIHVKNAANLLLEGGHLQNAYVKIQTRNVWKRTNVVSTAFGHPTWNQEKHIPIMVMRNRKHPFNLVRISVHSFDIHGTGKSAHHEIGSVSFHLHDVIKAGLVDGPFDIWNRHQIVGELRLRVDYYYGFFGFGYSSQLRLTEQLSMVSFLRTSLLPRLPPPMVRFDSSRAALIPRFVEHPSMIPFKNRVSLLGDDDDEQGPCPRSNSRADFDLVKWKTSTRLEQLKDAYLSLPNRFEKLRFLHSVVVCSTRRPELVKSDAYVKDGVQTQAVMQYMMPTKNLIGQSRPSNVTVFQLHAATRLNKSTRSAARLETGRASPPPRPSSSARERLSAMFDRIPTFRPGVRVMSVDASRSPNESELAPIIPHPSRTTQSTTKRTKRPMVALSSHPT
eukprot:Rmarinus@m.29357